MPTGRCWVADAPISQETLKEYQETVTKALLNMQNLHSDNPLVKAAAQRAYDESLAKDEYFRETRNANYRRVMCSDLAVIKTKISHVDESLHRLANAAEAMLELQRVCCPAPESLRPR